MIRKIELSGNESKKDMVLVDKVNEIVDYINNNENQKVCRYCKNRKSCSNYCTVYKFEIKNINKNTCKSFTKK